MPRLSTVGIAFLQVGEDVNNQSPSGKYARQIGFLFETLTGRELEGVGALSGNYVPVVDPDLYVTPEGLPDSRWRVYNNLPGDRRFCPLIRKTDVIEHYMAISLANEIKSGYSDVDPILLRTTQTALCAQPGPDAANSEAI